MFRGKVWNSSETHFFPRRQSIPNSEISSIVKSHDIPWETFVHDFFFIREERIRRRELHFLIFSYQKVIFISFKSSGNNFHESQTVTVFRIHIGVNFKDKSCEIFFFRFYQSGIAFFRLRIWCDLNKSIE